MTNLCFNDGFVGNLTPYTTGDFTTSKLDMKLIYSFAIQLKSPQYISMLRNHFLVKLLLTRSRSNSRAPSLIIPRVLFFF